MEFKVREGVNLFGSWQDPGDTYCDKSLGIMKGNEFPDQVSEYVSKKGLNYTDL